MHMKKIATLNLNILRVEESFGYLKLVSAETPVLNPGGGGDRPEIEMLSAAPTDSAVDAFSASVEAFDQALKDPGTTPAITAASTADQLRDASYRSLAAYTKAMEAFPDEPVALIATQVKALINKYGNPTELPQTEESGVLHNLLQDLKALPQENRTKIAIDPWVTDLETKETSFLAAVKTRTEEEAARLVGIVKQARLQAEADYRAMVELVNALVLINGDAAYATFIDHVNALIDRQKTVLKTRKTVNAKKKGDSDRPEIESAR